MPMKLYVGNLSFKTTSEELRELFTNADVVEAEVVVEDRDTGRSRGFGFVEMSTKEEGEAAIAQLSGKELGGRNLTVNERVPAGRGGERGPRVGRDTARRRADKRADKLEGEIEAALNYVESIRAVSAADWDEIERLRNETQLLLAEMKAA